MTVRSARDLARKLVRETAVVAHGVVKGHKSSARPSSGHARDKATTHGTHGRKTFGARAKRHVGCEKQTQKLRDDAEWLRELRRRAAAVAVSIVVAAMSTPDPAQAGFGAPTGAVSSPPLPEQQLEELLSMDRRAAIRKTNLIRTSDFDILLQELNALTQLDEKLLEAADAEIALKISENLAVNIKDAEDSLKIGATSPSERRSSEKRFADTRRTESENLEKSAELSSQRLRLLERRRVEAEFQKKLLQRKVDESRLQSQPQWLVYGAALGASVLSTAVMHPVDTVKVRKQALGAEKLAATNAAAVWELEAESTAFAAVSATTVTAAAAVDARVVAAAEFGPEASFDAFDDGPTAVWGSFDSFDSVRETTSTETASAVTTATVTKQRPTEVDVSDVYTSTTTTSSPFASLDQAFEDLEQTYGVDATEFEEAQMPMSSALAAVALSTSSPKIWAPIGVPLTPAGLASLYDGLLPNIVKEGPPLALYLGIYEYLKTVLLATDLADSPVVCYLIAGAVGELIGSYTIWAPIGVPLTPAGLASLYDGLLPNIVKEGPPLALYLGIYEYLKTVLLATDLADSPVVCYLIAGAVGELIGSVLRVPAEAVKSTQQSKSEISLQEALALNFSTKEGRDNCVEAWTVAVTRDVPFGAIQIALFEALKIYLAGMANPPFDGDSFLGEAVLGAIGGGVGAFISAPMDVVVVRLIKQQTQSRDVETQSQKLGAVDMAKLVYQEGGVTAFFRGSTERVLYWAPAIGIFLTAYCQIRHALL